MVKTVVEEHKLYNGEVTLQFLPNSHTYKVDGDKKIGVTTITGVLNKEALMLWPMDEAITFLRRALADTGRMWSTAELETLLEEAKTAFRKKQLRGTDAGTKAHDYLEQYLKYINGQVKTLEETLVITPMSNFEDPTTDEAIRAADENNLCKALDHFKAWYRENDVEVIHLEKIVYSREYDYCGKFDALLKINGKVYMVDFKTSNPSREFLEGVYPENFAQTGGYDIAFTEEFPDVHIDGHAIINLSKKTGKMNVIFSEDRDLNREFFLMCLGAKRGMQHHTRLLSVKYQKK